MKRTILTTPIPVIPLDRAKLQCKITGIDRDADIRDAIAAARDYAEEYLGLPVGERTMRFTYDHWCGRVELPCDITEVLAVTAAGVPVKSLPVPDERVISVAAAAPVVITIKAGWTEVTLPGVVKAAMLLMIADLIRNPQRQSENQLYKNDAFEALLWPKRERPML